VHQLRNLLEAFAEEKSIILRAGRLRAVDIIRTAVEGVRGVIEITKENRVWGERGFSKSANLLRPFRRIVAKIAVEKSHM
jgi:hypothetical protein